MFQLEIPKRSTCCIKGGEPLLQGIDYYSALVRNDGEEIYQRQDYCLACWEGFTVSQQVMSSWRSTVPFKKETSELPKRRDERALYLLKELLANEDMSSGAMAQAFVLALYLARRRLIFLRQELKREGKPLLSLYEVAETEEMLCIPKLAISDLQIDTIQLELAKKFKM